MGSAKDIVLRPIDRRAADTLIKRVHYSGKVVNNSQLSIGVFYAGKLEGAMQFGPSLDKRKMQGLVRDTGWNDFLELNRMAFSDVLPRNSESRALGIAMRMLHKHAPHIQWVVSFADATQCGDGTIYRASGFVLTGIKQNNSLWVAPDGTVIPRLVATNNNPGSGRDALIAYAQRFNPDIIKGASASMRPFIDAGYTPIPGFQLRYMYFIDPSARERCTVPILPFSEIERRGARMYKGVSLCAASIGGDAFGDQPKEGGAAPTAALHNS